MVNSKRILSINELAHLLGISTKRLRQITRDIKSHYRVWSEVDLKKQKSRCFRVPDDELMELQRRIVSNVLNRIPLPDSLHGGVKGRSPASNAAQHLSQPVVVNIDVRDYFPCVSHKRVHHMFRHEFSFGRDVSFLLARLTTFDGQLPQGAPTSTAIANHLLTQAVDEQLMKQASKYGVRYTRFVDDITLSGKAPQRLINEAGKLLSRRGLRIWRSGARSASGRLKLQIKRGNEAQQVTGLNVNSPRGPTVNKAYRDRVRAAIHQLGSLDIGERATAVRSIKGRIAYVRQFNRGVAARLSRSLDTSQCRKI